MSDSKSLRIVYMGTPDFAVEPLKALVDGGYNVVGVITMPDKPSGRGLKVQESAVKRYANQVGLPILQPEKLRDETFIDVLKSWNPELGVVIAFRMLPEVVWNMPIYGTINLHASLLPDYRGAAPINWAIINGEKTTGVTTFLLNHQIDEGDILLRKEIPILPEDDAGTLHDKLMYMGADVLIQSVELIAQGKANFTQQSNITNANNTKNAPKIFKNDCKIDWTQDCEVIHNKIRGLSPYPAAYADIVTDAGDISVKVFKSSFQRGNFGTDTGISIGEHKDRIDICTCNGIVTIYELQVAGKRRMSVADFLNGSKLKFPVRFK